MHNIEKNHQKVSRKNTGKSTCGRTEHRKQTASHSEPENKLSVATRHQRTYTDRPPIVTHRVELPLAFAKLLIKMRRRSALKSDQLIPEFPERGDGAWVHIGFRRNSPQRKLPSTDRNQEKTAKPCICPGCILGGRLKWIFYWNTGRR